jgi:hypothetical protein
MASSLPTPFLQAEDRGWLWGCGHQFIERRGGVIAFDGEDGKVIACAIPKSVCHAAHGMDGADGLLIFAQLHTQPIFSHSRGKAGTPHQCHLLTCQCQLTANQTTDCARANNQNLHTNTRFSRS